MYLSEFRASLSALDQVPEGSVINRSPLVSAIICNLQTYTFSLGQIDGYD